MKRKKSVLLAAIFLLLLSILFTASYIYSDSVVGEILLKKNSELLVSSENVNSIEYNQTGKSVLQLEIPFIGQEYPKTQNNTSAKVAIDYNSATVKIEENNEQTEYTIDEFVSRNVVFQESFWDNIFQSKNYKVDENRDEWKITIFSSNLNKIFMDELESLFRRDFEAKEYKLGEITSEIEGNIDLEIFISKESYLVSKVIQRLNGNVTLSSSLGGKPIEELEETIDIEDKTVKLYVSEYELASDIEKFEVEKQFPKNSLTIWLSSI